MSRLMSVSLTEQAVIERRKTVTRRLGWTFLKPGDRLTLCRKVQGRKRKDGTVEPLVRLAEVEVVSVRREPLWRFPVSDIEREGVPVEIWDEFDLREIDPPDSVWAAWYCEAMGCEEDDEVTRIEWRYLPVEPGEQPE